MKPLDINIARPANPLWLEHLRWVNEAHYQSVIGAGDLRVNLRVTANGRFLCHFIPSVLEPQFRRDLFELLLLVARNKASATKRVKNVGGGEHPLTRAGTPSIFARPRPLTVLKAAKEGVFGFQGAGTGGGCRPCAFNQEFPKEYRRLVARCEWIHDMAREHEPERIQRQLEIATHRRHLLIGRTGWSQGVGNLQFPMTAHSDNGNAKGSLSALTAVGDYDGGPLIFAGYDLAVALRPGDVLLFNGREQHGLGPFSGVRLSLALYLHSGILSCPKAE